MFDISISIITSIIDMVKQKSARQQKPPGRGELFFFILRFTVRRHGRHMRSMRNRGYRVSPPGGPLPEVPAEEQNGSRDDHRPDEQAHPVPGHADGEVLQALHAPLEACGKRGPQPLAEGQGDLLVSGEAVDLPEGEGIVKAVEKSFCNE